MQFHTTKKCTHETPQFNIEKIECRRVRNDIFKVFEQIVGVTSFCDGIPKWEAQKLNRRNLIKKTGKLNSKIKYFWSSFFMITRCFVVPFKIRKT